MHTIIDDRTSFAELRTLQDRGHSVVRTPHLGNMHPSAMASMRNGMVHLLVDHNITGGERHSGADNIFHPHQRSGMFVSPERIHAPGYAAGAIQPVVDAHMTTLRTVIPEANGNVRLLSEYFSGHQGIVLGVMRAYSRTLESEGHWTQRVDGHGFIHKHPQGANNKEVSDHGLWKITNPDSGFTVPLIVCVMSIAIIEAMTSGKADIYHVAGQVMTKYMQGYSDFFAQTYPDIRREITAAPPKLRFHLIPGADSRFVTSTDRSAMLDEMVMLALRIHADPDDRRAEEALRHLMRKRFTDPLYNTDSPGSVLTQHSLSETGTTLYEHPINRHLPPRILSSMIKKMRSLR